MERVKYFFEEISKIPRRSGNTKGVSDFCVNFAKEHSLEWYQDEWNNVVIYKAASAGFEDKEPVILQGHLDMVCEFDTAITLVEENGFLRADGTTLGADDGVAVAMCLAILEDDKLCHPELCVVFTTDEETGMFGARGLDASKLCGRRLLNIDSEEEGVLTVGCAGGERAVITLPVTPQFIPIDNDDDNDCYSITISGLLGGHSGVDIGHGRINAVLLLANFLAFLESHDVELRLIDIKGGTADNAIPNSASVLLFASSMPEELVSEFETLSKTVTDPDLKIVIESIKMPASVTDENTGEALTMMLGKNDTERVIEYLMSLPNGVQGMRGEEVETSLNLGQIFLTISGLVTRHSLRSNVTREKKVLEARLINLADDFKAKIEIDGDYPGWDFVENSPFCEKVVECYKNCYGEEPKVVTIHAGLECGLFAEKVKGLDAVSIGPTIYDIHTTAERLDLSSLERTYKFVRNVLENL